MTTAAVLTPTQMTAKHPRCNATNGNMRGQSTPRAGTPSAAASATSLSNHVSRLCQRLALRVIFSIAVAPFALELRRSPALEWC